jgi:hypothetical protein
MNKWLQRHRITEFECLIPDLTGIARGKIMPADKFLRKEGIRLPENLFLQTVPGNWGLVSTSAVMMVAPIAILFMFFQKRFIAGLTSGATKG